jgi:hypothetical protein
VLPDLHKQRSIQDIAALDVLPRLRAADAICAVRAARMYQDALWVATSEPALAWLMLVTAVETAAQHRGDATGDAVEELRRWGDGPRLLKVLARCGEAVTAEVAKILAKLAGATRKFIEFHLQHLPPPPPDRPASGFQHLWDEKEWRKTLSTIYGHRSNALHEGRPFPAPMCMPPFSDPDGRPSEIPLGISGSDGVNVWGKKDTPLLLHTYAYLARHSLLGWMRLRATQP